MTEAVSTSTDAGGVVTLDGKATAKAVRADVAVAAASLSAKGRAPGLTVVLVGDDPASQVYVRSKDKAATEAGFVVNTIRLAADASQTDVESVVDRLNFDDAVDGILVQLPLPKGLDSTAVVERIEPGKDVDGLTASNVARLSMGRPGLVPCTPAGCIEILAGQGQSEPVRIHFAT